MNGRNRRTVHDNISQRAVDSYRRALVPFEADTADAHTEPRRQLRDFLAALYDVMYEDPARFGMSVAADDYLEHDEQGGDHKNTVLRKLKQPRRRIATTIELLRSFGEHGRLTDDGLLMPLADYRALIATAPGIYARCIKGLAEAGLTLEDLDTGVVASSARYPQMMAALAELARAQTARQDGKQGHTNLARCDYGSLSEDHQAGVEDVFSYLEPEAREHATRLHEYMLEAGYAAKMAMFGIHECEVDYQGPRKIKTTQLVRIRYDDRYRDPAGVYVMPAATNRLVPHLADAPERLQSDFLGRVHECHPDCRWCEKKKSLGPAEIGVGGESRSVCWFTQPSFIDIGDGDMELVREYVRWHEALA
jgi:hypothetical protein